MEKVQIGDATLYHGDCLEVLPTLDKVDAVVTDPPYGIGEAAGKNASRGNLAVAKNYGSDDWDDRPANEEVALILYQSRIKSIPTVIFGGNYYQVPPSPCWLIWDKENGMNDFADAELAWTNLKGATRRIRYMWNGMLRANKEQRGDHPTQKPVGVMTWAIQFIADFHDVDTVCDPMMGSGTTGVAAIETGRGFIGIEKHQKYFDIACERIEAAYAQGRLFA